MLHASNATYPSQILCRQITFTPGAQVWILSCKPQKLALAENLTEGLSGVSLKPRISQGPRLQKAGLLPLKSSGDG